MLEDSLKQATFLEEGEGSSSTIFGSYNYKVLYGRLAPRYDDTKDDIDIDMLLEKGVTRACENGSPAEESFSMEGCLDFAVFPDDTLLLYRDCDRRDASGYFYEFQTFDLEGNLLSLWGRTEEKQGFWGRMKMWFGSRRRAPHFSDTSDYPVRTRDSDIRLAIGQDGSVYMLSYTMLLRLDCSGKKVYLADSHATTQPEDL